MNPALVIEPDGAAVHEPCPDCGESTRSVWGYASSNGDPRAAYFIRWTDGHLERGAQILVSLGAWGPGSEPSLRRSFGFECRMGADRPGFMVVDATTLPWSAHAFLGAKLLREDALGDPLLPESYAILDELIEQDPRFRQFLLTGFPPP